MQGNLAWAAAAGQNTPFARGGWVLSGAPHTPGPSKELVEPADLLSAELAGRGRLPERELPADIRVIPGASWKTARENALCCSAEADCKCLP